MHPKPDVGNRDAQSILRGDLGARSRRSSVASQQMLFLAVLALANHAAYEGQRVVVIENLTSPTSVEVTQAYQSLRGVKNIVKVACQDSALDSGKETMSYPDYVTQVEQPLKEFLKTHPQVDFIVLTKGVPIRLTGAPTGMGNSQPSLDSTIAALGYSDRKDTNLLSIEDSGFKGRAWENRFWNSKERFSHSKFGGYLVTRLDGYTSDEARLLVRYAIDAEKTGPTGTILLDTSPLHGLGDVKQVPKSIITSMGKSSHTLGELNYNEFDADMVVAGDILTKKKVPILLDRTEPFIGHKGDLMGYCSWGSNDPKFDSAGYLMLRFSPGAIAETAVSTSGRTFLPTSGGQSLIADLIRGRVTGVKGYCDEPLLQAIASPTILFDRYTDGWSLAESFYAASRLVGWEDIVIGDPLCAPYPRRR